MTRRVPLIVAAIALLLTVAYWFLLYQPRADQLASYRDETAQLESQAAQLQADIAALHDVEANAEEHRSQLGRLVAYIPEDPSQPDTLRELQRVADQSGVEITELTYADPELVPGAPETGQPDEILASIPTQMTVDGGYFQVIDMLRRIEVDLDRAMKIDTVSMAESEELFPDLTVTCTGRIFAVLEADEVTGEDGQILPPTTPEASSSEAPSEGATAGAADGAAPDDSGDAQAGTS